MKEYAEFIASANAIETLKKQRIVDESVSAYLKELLLNRIVEWMKKEITEE